MPENGNGIKKKTGAIADSEKKLSKIKEELRAQCTHTHHGEPSLVPSNDPRVEGTLKYLCKQCNKPVIISAIDEEDLQKAAQLIDQAIDIIKITAGSINNEQDAEILKKIAKLQYRVRNDLLPTYRAAIKKGNNNKRNHNNHGNDSSWGRPQVLGGR